MNDDDYRALVEQAQQVRELKEHPGWEVLSDFWHAQTKNAKHAVLNGNVSSIEKYKAMTGELIGVYKVLDTSVTLDGMVNTERQRREMLAEIREGA